MLTIKVKMYAGYLHILGMVHDCKWKADITNHELKRLKKFENAVWCVP
jgi:hypothetical protein